MMNKNVRMRMRGCENVDDVGRREWYRKHEERREIAEVRDCMYECMCV